MIILERTTCCRQSTSPIFSPFFHDCICVFRWLHPLFFYLSIVHKSTLSRLEIQKCIHQRQNNKMTSKKDLEAGPRLVADDDMLLDIDDSGSTTSKDDMSEKVSLAQRETKAVTLFRALLMLVLAAVACSVSATAFILTKAREHSAFKTESYHQSEKVCPSLHPVRFLKIYSSTLTTTVLYI